MTLPDANTAGMQAFLDDVATNLAKTMHVALVLDSAGWHGKSLQVLTNITLVKLPPYWPELNPVERM